MMYLEVSEIVGGRETNCLAAGGGRACLTVRCAQVFFDLMREIRSRKSDDSRATNGDVRGKKRRKMKCAIL